MRYLTGLVAGDALAAPTGSSRGTPRNGKCVAYIAAYPIAEVQRGINAFTLGCRARFPDCTVKVVWTGTWHSAEVEGAAAHYFWNVEQCDLITQHSDTSEPQRVFSAYGGVGIGYNSDMRTFVGDSVLSAPMFEWGPAFGELVTQELTQTWQPSQSYWPGAAEGAVKLAPAFSPRVSPATVQHVEQEHSKLRAASGDGAFNHIFCGPLLKRWAYEFATPADGSGPRAQGCGFNPIWRRLDPPEQINLRHYRDQNGDPLPSSQTAPQATDCLWGMSFAGEALVSEAFPAPFVEDLVFSDYLIDGVELLQPQGTQWGTVHNDTSHGCFTAYGTSGDRFFSPPPWPGCPAGSAMVGRTCEECPENTYEHDGKCIGCVCAHPSRTSDAFTVADDVHCASIRLRSLVLGSTVAVGPQFPHGLSNPVTGGRPTLRPRFNDARVSMRVAEAPALVGQSHREAAPIVSAWKVTLAPGVRFASATWRTVSSLINAKHAVSIVPTSRMAWEGHL
jgi:hypothetical protein